MLVPLKLSILCRCYKKRWLSLFDLWIHSDCPFGVFKLLFSKVWVHFYKFLFSSVKYRIEQLVSIKHFQRAFYIWQIIIPNSIPVNPFLYKTGVGHIQDNKLCQLILSHCLLVSAMYWIFENTLIINILCFYTNLTLEIIFFANIKCVEWCKSCFSERP